MNNTPNEITTEDHLDSRNIEDRIKYLNGENDLDADDTHELNELEKLKAQYIGDYSESSWEFGAQFHRVDDFENYAQELAEDIGAVKEGMQWPNSCIDWEQAARELAMDYTEVTFNGVDYYTQEA